MRHAESLLPGPERGRAASRLRNQPPAGRKARARLGPLPSLPVVRRGDRTVTGPCAAVGCSASCPVTVARDSTFKLTHWQAVTVWITARASDSDSLNISTRARVVVCPLGCT